jgi:AraC family transcriptional activator of pobA
MPSMTGFALFSGLFGESTDLPDAVHCETIASRSSLHDWELAPHRHDRLHQLLFLQAGAGTVYFEGEGHELVPPCLVNVPPGTVHAFVFQPGTEGFVVTMADEMLDFVFAGAETARQVLAQAAQVPVDEAMAQGVGQIWREFNGLAPVRDLVLRGLCTALLGQVARAMAAQAEVPANAALDRQQLLKRLQALIEAHFLAHWSVADYARALALSTSHLTRCVKAATGQPVSHLIEARLLREARRQLIFTNKRLATISDELGFVDPAYFSRFFSRNTGLSPRAFRQRGV